MRKILCLIAVFSPMAVKRLIYNAFGWTVDTTSRVGFSYIDAQFVKIGPRSQIRHGTIIKGLRSFELGADCYVKNFNQFFAQTDVVDSDRMFLMGDRSQVMSRHFFDVAGRVTIGNDSIVAGRDVQFWTHSQVVTRTGMTLRIGEIEVGDNCYIGARATVVEARIPTGCVVGAAAVLTGRAGDSIDVPSIFRGNPARARAIE